MTEEGHAYEGGWRNCKFYPEKDGILMFATFGFRLVAGFQDLEEVGAPQPVRTRAKILLIDETDREVISMDFAEFLYRVIFNTPPLSGVISKSLHMMLNLDGHGPWFVPDDR